MSSEGKNNKRKYPYNGRNPPNYHQNKKKNGGPMPRDYRWNRTHQPESGNYFQNYPWIPPSNKNNYNTYQHSNYNSGFHQPFYNSPSPLLTEHPNEPEEATSVGPGSETDRMEKVMAIKRRIEEALAAKSSNVNSSEITIPDSSSAKEVSKDKESDKNLPVTNLDNDRIDLKLTNSDFKEIGSVASSVVVEGEGEASDLTANISCASQQRSFDSAAQPSIQIPKGNDSSINKSQRIGGWNMSSVNEIVTTEQVQLNRKDKTSSNQTKSRKEMFIQESREKVLGNIEPAVNEQIPVSKNSTPKQSERSGFERVGKLYQSFLKSRLCGYTLKMRQKSAKNTGPNPLLDKSVLENQTRSSIKDALRDNQIIELEMPRPIIIKTDNSELNEVDQTPEEVAAEEAKEFCQEFSYLLTYPNFLIPPENLEKLGLGHLSEMNKLIDERRTNPVPPEDVSAEKQDSFLRVRSLNALNSVTENDIVYSRRSLDFSPLLQQSNSQEPPLITENSNCMTAPCIPNNVTDLQNNFSGMLYLLLII